MSKAAYGAIHAQYTVLEYIESTGTQYIDTGIQATQNTRIIMDHTLMSSGGDASLFGAWDGFASNGFIYVVLSGMTSGYWCYANGTSGISMTAAGRHTVDANQNVLTLDGTTLATATAATFTGSYPIYLFAHNEAGTASNRTAMRCHGCRIYDGDTMVRDYVPVPGPAGVGLYDRVTGTFSGNAGSGEFIAGPATGEVIDAGSQTRKVKKIYAAMDGLTRKVKKGYAVIGGTTRLFFSAGVSVVYTGTHTVEDASLDGVDYVLYTLTGSGTLTLDGAEDNVRYWMCGGGAAGASGFQYSSSSYYGGCGGSGGFVADGVLASGQYAVVIGAGGSNNSSGGATDIGGIVANGGIAETGRNSETTIYGGSGGGSDYRVMKGAGVSTYPFGMTALSAHSAGGGSGAAGIGEKGGNGGTNGGNGTKSENRGWTYAMGGSGGTKGGGSGGGFGSGQVNTGMIGAPATFYGSGGGGGAANKDGTTKTAAGGAGYQGVAYILIPKEAIA